MQLEDALDEFGSMVCVGENKFLPYWFEFTEDYIYAHSLGEQIPEELKLHIESKEMELILQNSQPYREFR